MIMDAHINNPRMLEDAMCGLSNIAFTNDEARLQIGRQCGSTIVRVLGQFARSPYLFSMGLRAVGNLTRCDENIARMVGHGVMLAVVEGMRAGSADVEMTELAADVVGNLASLDSSAIALPKAVEFLAVPPVLRPARAGEGVEANDPELPDAVPGLDSAELRGRCKEEGVDAVITHRLVGDGAVSILVEVMKKHSTQLKTVKAALRALFYVANSKQTVKAMTNSGLLSGTAFAMRAGDYDVEVVRRAARLIARVTAEADADVLGQVLDSGVVSLLLSAIDTHNDSRDASVTCYAVLRHISEGIEALDGKDSSTTASSSPKKTSTADLGAAASGSGVQAMHAKVSKAVAEYGALATAFSRITEHKRDGEYVLAALQALEFWSRSDVGGSEVASQAVTTLKLAMAEQRRDPLVQQSIVMVLSELMRHEAYAQSMVVLGGMVGLKKLVADNGHIFTVASAIAKLLDNVRMTEGEIATSIASTHGLTIAKCMADAWRSLVEGGSASGANPKDVETVTGMVEAMDLAVSTFESFTMPDESDVLALKRKCLWPSNVVKVRRASVAPKAPPKASAGVTTTQSAGPPAPPASTIPAGVQPGVSSGQMADMIEALMLKGLACTQWSGAKSTKVMLELDADARGVTVSKLSGKTKSAKPVLELKLDAVGLIGVGNPSDAGKKKRRMSMARMAKMDRAMYLSGDDQATLLHVECDTPQDSKVLHGALIILSNDARSEAGKPLPAFNVSTTRNPAAGMSKLAAMGGGGMETLAE
jgi:hypothetical protein